MLTTFGIGAIIDLPNISVMVMGLEDWPLKDTVEIGEERLLASVREVLGSQVQALRSAPVPSGHLSGNPFDASALVGIPVAPFPRWMVCPALSPLGLTQQRAVQAGDPVPDGPDSLRPCQLHPSRAGRRPSSRRASSWPARNGHLDDFPWREFVHRGPTNCKGGLKLFELTATGEAAGIEVRCEGETLRRVPPHVRRLQDGPHRTAGLSGHVGHNSAIMTRQGARGRRAGSMRMTAMLQGASNSWFALTLSALAIPQASRQAGATRRGALDDPGEGAERPEHRTVTAGHPAAA